MIEVHEIADLWPQMANDEWAEFVADIKANGLLTPIVTWRNKVVDGKHRYKACVETGTDPRFDSLPDNWDEWRVVTHCSSLHRRRNLTPAQRAAVGAEAVEKYAPKARERQQVGRPPKNENKLAPRGAKISERGKAAAAAAKDIGSTERSVERASFVRKNAPEVFEKVKAGEVSLKVAERIAKAPPERQSALLNQLDTGARSEDAGDSWGTPPQWIALAHDTMGGIDLDPATNAKAQETVGAAKFFTKEDDGLSKKWFGRVWMNPPYSQPLVTKFAEKLVTEIEAGNVTQACVLVNNATDTKFLQNMLKHCAAALFPSGRVSFLVPETGEELSGTRQGQTFLYFGENVQRFINLATGLGWVGVSP